MKKIIVFCLLALAIIAVLTVTLCKVSLTRSDETIARIDHKIEMYERGR